MFLLIEFLRCWMLSINRTLHSTMGPSINSCNLDDQNSFFSQSDLNFEIGPKQIIICSNNNNKIIIKLLVLSTFLTNSIYCSYLCHALQLAFHKFQNNIFKKIMCFLWPRKFGNFIHIAICAPYHGPAIVYVNYVLLLLQLMLDYFRNFFPYPENIFIPIRTVVSVN